MNRQLSLFPLSGRLSNGIDEYLLLIAPNPKVTNSIFELKRGVRPLCNWKGVFSTPHITVAKIKIKRRAEPYILPLLQIIFSRHQKFTVELEDFASFEHLNFTCTIYIKVKEHQPFLELAEDLKAARREFKKLAVELNV